MSNIAVYAPLAWLGPQRLVADAVVLIEGDTVVYADDRAGAPAFEPDEEIEVRGFLMPAAADRHVHIGLADPFAVLARGVTAVRDLGWPTDAIFRLAEDSTWAVTQGPLIVPSGPVLTAPGGYPSNAAWAPPGTAWAVESPEQARLAVKDLAHSGVGQIKVAIDAEAGPTMDDATLVAIVEAANARSLPVTAHAHGPGQIERAIGAGVAELAHTPWSERLHDRVIEAMAKSLRVVSTLDVFSRGNDTQEIRNALDNLRRFHALGGNVVYGTDLGNGPVPPGIHVRELLLLREAGLSPDEIIAALIRAPLEPGAPADLIVTPESPFGDLSALAELWLVMRAGKVVMATSAP